MESVSRIWNNTPRCNFTNVALSTVLVIVLISLDQMLFDDEMSCIDYNIVLEKISTLLRGLYVEILLLFIIGLLTPSMPFLNKFYKDNPILMVAWLSLYIASYALLTVKAMYGANLMISWILAFNFFAINLVCLNKFRKIIQLYGIGYL